MYGGITVSLKVISVLSLWSRMEVISSHLSIFPPFLVHLKHLKFYKAPTMCQIIPKFHSVSVYGALIMCQVFLWALWNKDKKPGPWTLRDREKAAVHPMKLIDIFVEVTINCHLGVRLAQNYDFMAHSSHKELLFYLILYPTQCLSSTNLGL